MASPQTEKMTRGVVDDKVPTVADKYYDGFVASMPSQEGRVAIVTGSNTGVGFYVALALLKKGATVVMACRTLSKAEKAKEELLSLLAADGIQGSKIDIIQLDTSKFASVKKFATEFQSQYDRLDLLLNNAGVMAQKPRMTEDNFDIQIQTNHLGHFLLTSLLMDQLIAAGRQGGVPARVVNQSSQAHSAGKPGFGPSGEVDSGGFQVCCGLLELCCPCACTAKWSRYGRSKLANMLFSNELQARLQQNKLDDVVVAVTSQPGFCSTQLQMHAANDGAMPCWQCIGRNGGQSPADGAMPMLMAATDPKVAGGMFVEPSQGTGTRGLPIIAKSRGNGSNGLMAARLWDASNETTGASWPVLAKN